MEDNNPQEPYTTPELPRDIRPELTRKGVTKDYLNHLTPEHWARVDEVFAERMGGLEAFAPLRPYMARAG